MFSAVFYSTDKKYQMYFEGSVVGKASTIRERSRPPSPNFHRGGVKIYEIWRRLKHRSNLSRPRLKMQQDFGILKQKCNAAMIALCRGQVW